MASRFATLPATSAPRGMGSIAVGGFALVCLVLVWRSFEGGAPAVFVTSTLGRPVRWVLPDIVLRPNADSDAEFSDMLQAIVVASATTWNGALAGCRAPRLRVLAAPHRSLLPLRDGCSTVLVRRNKWCSDSVRDQDDCYDKDRAAFTSLYPNDPDGSRYADVREADIEVNGVNYAWSPEGAKPGTSSLHAIVVHELGHVLGLDHPCEVSPQRAGAKPRCGSSKWRASIMYPLPLEVGRIPVLEPAHTEREALCAFYARPRTASERAVGPH